MTILNATSAPYNLSTSGTAAANQTALAAWWAALSIAAIGTVGYIPAGTYNIAGNNTWDFTNRAATGITVYGDGMYETILNFTAATGTALQIQAGSASTPSTAVGYYYNHFRDICFQANTTGVAFKIGKDNGGDSIQASTWNNVIYRNPNSAATGGLRINGHTACLFTNVQGTAYPATSSVDGSGFGLEIVIGAFNTFRSCSFGNANVGIQFSNNGDSALGYSYLNLFYNVDIENVQYGVKQLSCQATRNIFDGGVVFIPRAGGYGVSNAGGGLSYPGSCLVFKDTYFQTNPLYGTGTSPAIDPSNYIGITFNGGSYGTVTSPAFPSPSGAIYTNKTGQSQHVSWWGGAIGSVVIDGVSFNTTVNSTILAPGNQIAFGYTGSPSWKFRNLIN